MDYACRACHIRPLWISVFYLVVLAPHFRKAAAVFADAGMRKYGHMRVRDLLGKEEFPADFRHAPLVAQFSSIGSITPKWLQDFQHSFSQGSAHGPEEPASESYFKDSQCRSSRIICTAHVGQICSKLLSYRDFYCSFIYNNCSPHAALTGGRSRVLHSAVRPLIAERCCCRTSWKA